MNRPAREWRGWTALIGALALVAVGAVLAEPAWAQAAAPAGREYGDFPVVGGRVVFELPG